MTGSAAGACEVFEKAREIQRRIGQADERLSEKGTAVAEHAIDRDAGPLLVCNGAQAHRQAVIRIGCRVQAVAIQDRLFEVTRSFAQAPNLPQVVVGPPWQRGVRERSVAQGCLTSLGRGLRAAGVATGFEAKAPVRQRASRQKMAVWLRGIFHVTHGRGAQAMHRTSRADHQTQRDEMNSKRNRRRDLGMGGPRAGNAPVAGAIQSRGSGERPNGA